MSRSRTFLDSPMPKFSKKKFGLSNWFEKERISSYDILNICRTLKGVNSNFQQILHQFENACIKLIGNITPTHSISGIGLLSDSIEF